MTRPPRLAAGAFSAWAARTRHAQVSDDDAEVPCDACTACCRSSYFVHIGPDETRTLRRIPRELLFAAPGRPAGHVVLGYDERGHCPMLVDDACSIYEDRPLTCRKFDCRVLAAAGLVPEGAGKAPIADQVRRWSFEFPTPRDAAQHAAVRAAVAFLRAHPECFEPGSPPGDATQLSVIALEVHELFLEPGGSDLRTPAVEAVRAALVR